ncbi:MAG: hypothetical protein ACOYNP_15820 [Gemmataceae bacterium]
MAVPLVNNGHHIHSGAALWGNHMAIEGHGLPRRMRNLNATNSPTRVRDFMANLL